ncbi:hypothetical protein ACHAWF_000273, partial [Thalassiosira exigua]
TDDDNAASNSSSISSDQQDGVDLEVESDSDFTIDSKIEVETSALKSTNRRAKTTFYAKLKEPKHPHMISILWAMGVGLSDDIIQRNSINELVGKGVIPKSAAKVTNQQLKDEIARRHAIVVDLNIDESPKRPKLRGNAAELTARLADYGTHPLLHRTER